MNKKGSGRDLPLIVVLMFSVGAILLITSYIGTTAVASIIAAPVVNESSHAVTAFNSVNIITQSFDFIGLAVFIGLILGFIVLSLFLPAHPIFVLSYVLIWVITVVIAAVISNIWDQIVAVSQFAATIATLQLTVHLINNMPIYISVVGFIGAVILFGRSTTNESAAF